MSTELSTLRRDELSEMQRLGKMFAASGYFADVKDLAQACVKILAGKELGFSPFASMSGVYIVKGRPSLSAALMASAIVRAGFRYVVTKIDNNECSIDYFDSKDRPIGTSSFTMRDAQLAGNTGNDPWKKYPRNMLFARAMSNGCRWFCAGAFGGHPVYTPEEMGMNVDGEGAPILEPRAENAPRLEAANGNGAKPQTDATAALQAKLDAKKAKVRPSPTPAEVADIIPAGPGDGPGVELYDTESDLEFGADDLEERA